MMTVLLLACYLPFGLFPVLVPYRVLQTFRPAYPFLASSPLSLGVLAWLLARPLTNWLGYAAVLIPLGLSIASLTIGVAGTRLAWSDRREGRPYLRLSFLALLASTPFLLATPFLAAGAVEVLTDLLGR